MKLSSHPYKPRNYTLIVSLTVQFECKVPAVRSENERHCIKAYMMNITVLFKVTNSVLLLSRPSSNEHDGAITRHAKLARWRRTAESISCCAAGSPSDESRTPRPSESGFLYWFVTLYQLSFNTALLSTFCTRTRVVHFCLVPGIATVLVKFLQLFLFHLFKKMRRSISGTWRECREEKKSYDVKI